MTHPRDKRQALINGLHDLADFLQDHPDLPFDAQAGVEYCVSTGDDQAGITEIMQIARSLGADVTRLPDYPQVCRQFGPVSYRAFYVSRNELAAHRALMSYSGAVTSH